jgi:hypothetical protein
MEDLYENFNTFMSDAIYEIFIEEFERSKLIKSHYNYLQNFQLILEQVPLWNSPTCEKKWEFIVRHSNCDWLEDYYKTIMYAKVKNIVETYGLDSQELDAIKEFRCPSKEIFLRDLLSLCARNFYRNPYLFNSNNQLEKIENSTKIKKTICDNIKFAIHKFLPTREILKKCSPENILLNSVYTHKKKNVSDFSIQCDLEVNSGTTNIGTKLSTQCKQDDPSTNNINNTHVSDFSKISIENINSPLNSQLSKSLLSLSSLPSEINGGTKHTEDQKNEKPKDELIRISVPANIMRNIELPQGAQLSPKQENNIEKIETKTTDTYSSNCENITTEKSLHDDSSEKNTSISDDYDEYTSEERSFEKKDESSVKESSLSDTYSDDSNSMNNKKYNSINYESNNYQNLTKAFQETNRKNKKSLFKPFLK